MGVKIGIRGMGLIGGSFEKAFKKTGHEVVDLKDNSKVIPECEVIIVCLPPLMVAPWIKEHAALFSTGTIVTDAAGVKCEVCSAIREVARGASWSFIGGHPMARKERSGYENSEPELFVGASMIFTPYEWTRKEDLEKLKSLFSEIGFSIFKIATPEKHDEMIAYTSQLAHVVSSAYIKDVLASDHVGFSAGSFQDMTRVATVDPDMWTDLFLSNSEGLDKVLSNLIGRLFQYRDAINAKDSVTLKRLLTEGRAAKELSAQKRLG
jgi:prephenate dehydrogenase